MGGNKGVTWQLSPTPLPSKIPDFVLLNQNRRKAREYGSKPRHGRRGGRTGPWPVLRNGPCPARS